MRRAVFSLLFFTIFYHTMVTFSLSEAASLEEKQLKRESEMQELQGKFEWWPTDATPGPVKDEKRGGYWWWPTTPGTARPWGNRGYVYVYKIIFDYKEEELPLAEEGEPRPSLLIRKIIKNVKIYFDYDKADLRNDASNILEDTLRTLKKNPTSSILITGNCDRRGTEVYNLNLGRQRAEAVKDFILKGGISDARIKIVSRGKLDAIAPIADLLGMQKDRNAQFMVAEVEEVMIPYNTKLATEAKPIEEGKYLIEEEEEIKSAVRVSIREYMVKPGDTLSKIAKNEYGGVHRWKYLYELNKDRIKNPNKLKPGQKILIPVE